MEKYGLEFQKAKYTGNSSLIFKEGEIVDVLDYDPWVDKYLVKKLNSGASERVLSLYLEGYYG